MTDNRTVFAVRAVTDQLKKVRSDMKRWERDEPEYRDWCDGILTSAIAALEIISGG